MTHATMEQAAGAITTVLLAGGLGTRIRAIHPDVPKPLIPVAGRPFLYWATAYLAHHVLRRFLYSTGYKSELIAAWCGDASMPGLAREACAEAEPLGTGGGLRNCLPRAGAWILAANGDSLCLAGLPALLAHAAAGDCDAAIVGVFRADASRYGSLAVDEAGRLLAFREKAPGSGLVNAGTYLFRKDRLAALHLPARCSIETDIFPALLAAGRRIAVIAVAEAPFIDIGTPESLADATDFVRRHAEEFAW